MTIVFSIVSIWCIYTTIYAVKEKHAIAIVGFMTIMAIAAIAMTIATVYA
jgi:hypothetical protein